MLKTILRNYCSYIVLAVICLCIGGIIGYSLHNLHDDGGGNVSTRQQVESAVTANQEHQASVERIESGIEQAQDGINKAADRAASSEQLIGECQQILADIRTREEAR